MKRRAEDKRIVEVEGQKYASLKDGLFLKHPDLVDALCLLPTDRLRMFFAIWGKIKREKGSKGLMETQQGTIRVKGDCSECPFRIADDPLCSHPEIRTRKSRISRKASENNLYFYYDVLIVRRPGKRSEFYFNDFREISIDEVLDEMNQEKLQKECTERIFPKE
jgi:hypothetical protein